MKKIAATTIIVALLGTAPIALAQTGANPNAPQMNSTGTGVIQPGTDAHGTAVDRPTGTTGRAAMPTGSERGNNANSLHGSNSAASPNSNNAVEGRTSGGGSGN
jgi:hypothetical protein